MTHSLDDALKPCPFCGAIPKAGWRTSGEGVPCSNDKCRAEGPTSFPMSYHEGVRLWNTRVEAAGVAELREENDNLKHDVTRQMTIANIECNEAVDLREENERLREALTDARNNILSLLGGFRDEMPNVAVKLFQAQARQIDAALTHDTMRRKGNEAR